MYRWLWRALPGPTWVRVAICVALVAAVVAVCFTWAFPTIAPHVPFNEITVDQ
jgi:hypothetical protein